MPNGVGGGGSGGGTIRGYSNSFTGIATGIELLGNHCYAYNAGNVPAGQDFTALDFTTGNYYSVCRIYVLYDASDVAANNEFGYRFEMNGSTIAFTRRKASANDIVDAPFPPYVDIIIPAYTEFTVIGFSNNNSVDMSFQLTGRIYK